MVYSLVFSLKYCTFAPDLKITYGDPLAQLVEHHTFNVGVLGSNPKRITLRTSAMKSFFFYAGFIVLYVACELSFLFATQNNHLHNLLNNQKKSVRNILSDLA